MNAFPLASPPEPHEAGVSRQRAWVEVDADAIRRNAAALTATLAPGSSLMAVVKADGYGHGAAPVAQAALAGEQAASGSPPSPKGCSCDAPASPLRCWCSAI